MTEIGEEYRTEFEKEYGKGTREEGSYGQWLDLHRLPNGSYRSMVRHYVWAAFRHGHQVYNPNDE